MEGLKALHTVYSVAAGEFLEAGSEIASDITLIDKQRRYFVELREFIGNAIAKVDRGRGVIILTDLFGGTPSNLAISLMKSENVEVIAGVNLPMLIRLEGARKAMTVRAAVAADHGDLNRGPEREAAEAGQARALGRARWSARAR